MSQDKNDSGSSGEDDDEDGFELLTAENLFSTLLSRVSSVAYKYKYWIIVNRLSIVLNWNLWP